MNPIIPKEWIVSQLLKIYSGLERYACWFVLYQEQHLGMATDIPLQVPEGYLRERKPPEASRLKAPYNHMSHFAQKCTKLTLQKHNLTDRMRDRSAPLATDTSF